MAVLWERAIAHSGAMGTETPMPSLMAPTLNPLALMTCQTAFLGDSRPHVMQVNCTIGGLASETSATPCTNLLSAFVSKLSGRFSGRIGFRLLMRP